MDKQLKFLREFVTAMADEAIMGFLHKHDLPRKRCQSPCSTYAGFASAVLEKLKKEDAPA